VGGGRTGACDWNSGNDGFRKRDVVVRDGYGRRSGTRVRGMYLHGIAISGSYTIEAMEQ
jgi:hypothetical protein